MVGAPFQWSEDFEKAVKNSLTDIFSSIRFNEYIPLMKNRLLIGACRYGLLNDPDKPKWDRMERYYLEVSIFDDTGNLEHVVDALNMLLLEWEEGTSPHWFILASVNELLRAVHLKPCIYFQSIYNNVKTREL